MAEWLLGIAIVINIACTFVLNRKVNQLDERLLSRPRR